MTEVKLKENTGIEEPKGILFGIWKLLKYFSLDDGRTYTMTEAGDFIHAILASGREVYYSDVGVHDGLFHRLFLIKREFGKVSSLFGDFESGERDGGVYAIQVHKDRILDAGRYGLVDTKSDEVLISRREMRKRNVRSFINLLKDGEDLYGFVMDEDRIYNFSLIALPESSGRYSLGEEIFKYERTSIDSGEVIIVPWESEGEDGRIYPISVISCAHGGYLDLNNQKIEGTDFNCINNIALLHSDVREGKAGVIYSGWHSLKNWIVRAEIDLKERKAEKEILASYPSPHYLITALEPVYDSELHDKLKKRGRQDILQTSNER